MNTSHTRKATTALNKILNHYEAAISNWHDPLRPEAVAEKNVLEAARAELAELRSTSTRADY